MVSKDTLEKIMVVMKHHLTPSQVRAIIAEWHRNLRVYIIDSKNSKDAICKILRNLAKMLV